MAIDATQPTVLSQTYDKWAIASVSTMGDGLVDYGATAAPPIRLLVRLVKYRVREDGVAERSPLADLGDSRSFEIGDLYAEAAANPQIAQALSDLIAVVQSYASGKGIL